MKKVTVQDVASLLVSCSRVRPILFSAPTKERFADVLSFGARQAIAEANMKDHTQRVGMRVRVERYERWRKRREASMALNEKIALKRLKKGGME